MAATVSDYDAYYKVYKSLHLLTYEALPSVDNALKVWHTNQQQTLPVCTGQCPDGKKPKAPLSCQNCVAWGNAIEAACYPPPVPPAKPQITWQNVIQSSMGKSHIEAAKAYVLRLPKTKGALGSTHYTRISDFDSASVLMIMARFSGFHGGDQVVYDKIMKVIEIRNSLSHMGLHTNMLVDDQKVKEYVQVIESLIKCLAKLHPQHFTSARDVINKLIMIQMESVTDKMGEEINLELRTEILKLKETNRNECRFDLTQCQRQLKADYKTTRSGIAFLPGMSKNFSLDEFFVNLNLVEEEQRPTEVIRKTVVEYTDLFTLKNRNRERLCHVLIRGEAGSGKTTLLNRLAHQWATSCNSDGEDKAHNLLNEFELVFALSIRSMKPGIDLVDCIQDQLLPDMSKESIHNMLIAHADSCLFLFDGYDELKSHQEVLSSKYLHRGFVIVTTRPDKVVRFCQTYSGYVHVQLTGFTEQSRKTFISRYFASATTEASTKNNRNDNADELIKRIDNTYLDPLSLFPLLLAMMCSIFNKFGNIPTRMTALYEQAIGVFATQYYVKTSSSAYLLETQRNEIDSVLLSLGPTALHGLLIDDGKLIFSKEDFETKNCGQQTHIPVWLILLCGILPSLGYELGSFFDSSSLQFVFAIIGLFTGYILHIASSRDKIDDAIKLGLLSKVYNHSTQHPNNDYEYSFLHKTFQEFAAARYWSSLTSSNRSKFEYYLSRINKDNVNSMQYLLRFTCGLSYDAAEIILQHVVSMCGVDWRLAVTLLYEAERESRIHPPLHSILSSLKLDIMGSESTELWCILHHYASPKQFGYRTWLKRIKELVIRVEDNDQDLVRFLSNDTDFTLTSLDISIKRITWDTWFTMGRSPRRSSLGFKFLPSAIETRLRCFITSQCHLRHLGLAIYDKTLISGNSILISYDWKTLLTTKSFTKLISKLESISLEGICVAGLLDIFINAGKELNRQNSPASYVGSTNCLQQLGLPIRIFSVFKSSLNIEYADMALRDMNTKYSKRVGLHRIEDDASVLYKLKEALSYMPCLENLRLSCIGLSVTSVRALMPVISQMANIKVVDLGNHIYHSTIRLELLSVDEVNNLQHAGNELSEMLQNAANLRELNLAETNLTDDDIRLLSLNHPPTPPLTAIDLSGNQFGSDGLIHLSTLMRHTKMLRRLYMAGNTVYANGVAKFSPALRYVPLLTHLDITLGDEESYTLLTQGFAHVPKLQHLGFKPMRHIPRHILEWYSFPAELTISVKSAETIFRNIVNLPDLLELRIPIVATEDKHDSECVQSFIYLIKREVCFEIKDWLHVFDLHTINEIRGIVRR